MIEIEKPKIEYVEVNEEGTHGRFIIEPLERGYGITLGILYEEHFIFAAGAAVTSVKFDGVLHEFSTIEVF